ncbi:unnamed protein product [Phytophthora fragariaefolia]|uniref:Unnamed protein product n=1 Tax=Phytophthora fragariaefolia TaxID=1490495 RepID=A0A9W6TR73_9STRA|nr:unnamed protein product [Phytophthora fragariaefolia]
MVDQRDKDLKRMSEVPAERDIAYSALQGVAASYFEQEQEAAAVISSGGADSALRFANQMIDNQRRVIQRQKNVLRHNDRIWVTDPALALAAAAGIDTPGLSSGDLAINARLCRLLETRWPELSQVQPSEVREISQCPREPVPPRPPDTSDSAIGIRLSVKFGSSLGVCSVGCPCHKLGGFGLLHGCDFSAGIDGSASSRCFCWLGEFCPPSTRRASPQPTKASAGSKSNSARKSPTKSATGSSRRAPRNSAASPSSTSTVSPAPPTPGSARSQRASALNARAINSLELQALEASDAEVLWWSSGVTSSATRATSASSLLVIGSPSPPVITPTPTPVVTSSSQRQSSSNVSADDEVALQRSRRFRKKSVVKSDESSDSVAEALEEKSASPLTPASVSPAPSTGQKHPSSSVTPASTKKAHASASAKSSSPPHPAAKSNKAAKSATKTARGTVESGKSAKSADPTTPASGQSASASGTAAVSAPTSSASLGQAFNSAGGVQPHSDVSRLHPDAPDPRCPSSLKRLPRAGPDDDLA